MRSSAASCLAYIILNDHGEVPCEKKAKCSGFGPEMLKVYGRKRLQIFSVEDYRSGYPRFSALVAAHSSFHICRRFGNLRARLLLLKQDKLCMLEERLEKIDCAETAPLFLGSSRDDGNEERRAVLQNIDSALADYGMIFAAFFSLSKCHGVKPVVIKGNSKAVGNMSFRRVRCEEQWHARLPRPGSKRCAQPTELGERQQLPELGRNGLPHTLRRPNRCSSRGR